MIATIVPVAESSFPDVSHPVRSSPSRFVSLRFVSLSILLALPPISLIQEMSSHINSIANRLSITADTSVETTTRRQAPIHTRALIHICARRRVSESHDDVRSIYSESEGASPRFLPFAYLFTNKLSMPSLFSLPSPPSRYRPFRKSLTYPSVQHTRTCLTLLGPCVTFAVASLHIRAPNTLAHRAPSALAPVVHPRSVQLVLAGPRKRCA